MGYILWTIGCVLIQRYIVNLLLSGDKDPKEKMPGKRTSRKVTKKDEDEQQNDVSGTQRRVSSRRPKQIKDLNENDENLKGNYQDSSEVSTKEPKPARKTKKTDPNENTDSKKPKKGKNVEQETISVSNKNNEDGKNERKKTTCKNNADTVKRPTTKKRGSKIVVVNCNSELSEDGSRDVEIPDNDQEPEVTRQGGNLQASETASHGKLSSPWNHLQTELVDKITTKIVSEQNGKFGTILEKMDQHFEVFLTEIGRRSFQVRLRDLLPCLSEQVVSKLTKENQDLKIILESVRSNLSEGNQNLQRKLDETHEILNSHGSCSVSPTNPTQYQDVEVQTDPEEVVSVHHERDILWSKCQSQTKVIRDLQNDLYNTRNTFNNDKCTYKDCIISVLKYLVMDRSPVVLPQYYNITKRITTENLPLDEICTLLSEIHNTPTCVVPEPEVRQDPTDSVQVTDIKMEPKTPVHDKLWSRADVLQETL